MPRMLNYKIIFKKIYTIENSHPSIFNFLPNMYMNFYLHISHIRCLTKRVDMTTRMISGSPKFVVSCITNKKIRLNLNVIRESDNLLLMYGCTNIDCLSYTMELYSAIERFEQKTKTFIKGFYETILRKIKYHLTPKDRILTKMDVVNILFLQQLRSDKLYRPLWLHKFYDMTKALAMNEYIPHKKILQKFVADYQLNIWKTNYQRERAMIRYFKLRMFKVITLQDNTDLDYYIKKLK